MQLHRSFRYVTSILFVGLLAACSGDTTGPAPADPALSAVDGNNQSGTVGQSLANPIVVQITQGAAGVAGRTVTWTVTGGGGSVNPITSTTNNAGSAFTSWTMGPNPGANSLDAAGTGVTGSPVTFAATGLQVVPAPMTASVSIGDNFFNPASQRVAAGGTVTWTWTGAIGHNVTFPSGTPSGTQVAGVFSRAFPNTGTFDYLCTIHGSAMSGTIVVE